MAVVFANGQPEDKVHPEILKGSPSERVLSEGGIGKTRSSATA